MTRHRRAILSEKVLFLSDPRSYGAGTTSVEACETHMSWVFLANDRVYKLKKPLRRRFLDFSTIRKRRFFCEEEVRLNRRLTTGVYLGVVPLCRSNSGTFALGYRGRITDWLVEMKRLPQSGILENRILRGRVSTAEIAAVGSVMAGFYERNRADLTDGSVYIAHLVHEQQINRMVLMRRELGVADIAGPLLDRADRLLTEQLPEIGERIAAGLMVEGHGDLRPEHVCLVEPPQVIDCLEFNRAMRILDPYDEINYFGLECEMLGAGWIRQDLLAILERRFGTPPSDRLLSLYGAFRALLRARLCIVHLQERPVRSPTHWRPLAIRYLEQAERELSKCRFPEARKSIRSR
jgi:aminoglycoside phosphotransferase family enzyme